MKQKTTVIDIYENCVEIDGFIYNNRGKIILDRDYSRGNLLQQRKIQEGEIKHYVSGIDISEEVNIRVNGDKIHIQHTIPIGLCFCPSSMIHTMGYQISFMHTPECLEKLNQLLSYINSELQVNLK